MKYKCNDCDAIFEGSSYVNKCRECDSTSIEQVKESSTGSMGPIFDYIKKNKIVFGGIFVFIILLILKPSEKPIEETKYQLKFIPTTTSVKLFLEDEEKQKIAFNNKTHSWLNLKATFTDEQGDEYTLKPNRNEFFACKDGEILISWNNKSNRLFGISANSKSRQFNSLKKSNKCDDCCQPIIEIVSVIPSSRKNCLVTVRFNIAFDSNIMVSVNGKNGKYENKQFFDYSENMDVWAYYKGSKNYKVPYTLSIDKCTPPKKLSELEIADIRINTEKIINDMINSPNDPPTSFWNFYNNNLSVEFVIKEEKVGMSNITGYIDNLKDSGSKISLVEVVIDPYGKCTLIKLTY